MNNLMNTTSFRRVLSFFSVLTLGLGLVVAQEDPVIDTQSIVVNPKPSFDVNVFVDRDTSGDAQPSYRIGEDIRVGVNVSEAAYVYLFNVRSSGEILQFFPNRFDVHGSDNYLPAGQTRYFPDPDAAYTFSVDGPEGLDKVIAVASKDQLDTRQLADFTQDANFASSQQSEAGFASALSIVVKPKPQDSWVTDTALFYVGSGVSAAPVAPTLPTPSPTEDAFGTLSINSQPSGADVYVDGQFVGTTPLRFGTRSGNHTVRLELAGYPAYTTQVTLGAGQTLPLDVSLVGAQPNDGVITVTPTGNGVITVTPLGHSGQ